MHAVEKNNAEHRTENEDGGKWSEQFGVGWRGKAAPMKCTGADLHKGREGVADGHGRALPTEGRAGVVVLSERQIGCQGHMKSQSEVLVARARRRGIQARRRAGSVPKRSTVCALCSLFCRRS